MLPEIDLSRLRIEGVTCDLSEPSDRPGTTARIAVRVYDVRTGKRETVTSVRLVGPHDKLKQGIGPHIREAIRDVIAHEITECMTIDGKRVEDPHPEGGWSVRADGTARTSTRSDWEEPPAKCGCPKGVQAAIDWARANPDKELRVCQLAFQRINDSMGAPINQGKGWQRGYLEIPIFNRAGRTFSDVTFPSWTAKSERLLTLRVTDTKDHE
jgi:hypothetical protein